MMATTGSAKTAYLNNLSCCRPYRPAKPNSFRTSQLETWRVSAMVDLIAASVVDLSGQKLYAYNHQHQRPHARWLSENTPVGAPVTIQV